MLNPTHLHLILNHVPVVGLPLALVLLAYALWRKNEEFTRVALALVVFVALVGIPAYLTGEDAEETVEHLPGVSEHQIHEHEEAAETAFAGLVVAGLLSIVVATGWTRLEEYHFRLAGLSLLVALAVSLLLARTALLGGRIRHSEIRAKSVIGAAVPGHDGGFLFFEHEDEDEDDDD